MKLEPVLLVNLIIAPISWLSDIKFKEEPTVKSAQRMKGHGINEHHPCKLPLVSIAVAGFAGDEE
jgi:hypothetical protein